MELAISQISVLIPAYREERRLPSTLADISVFCKQNPGLVDEIVLVDDGSADRTSERAMYFSDKIPLKLIRHVKNQGKWAAVSTGIQSTKAGNCILLMDADGSTPLSEVLKTGFPKRGEAVMGTRFAQGSLVVGKGGLRRLLSKGYRLYVRVLMWYATGKWKQVDDTQCPFKLFYKEDMLGNLTEKRFVGDFELICLLQGVEFINKPVIFVDKKGSKVGLKSVLQMFRDTPLCAVKYHSQRRNL